MWNAFPLSYFLTSFSYLCARVYVSDQELKRGSTLNIIPPTPVKLNQSPAVAAAQQAVISTLRQHGASPQITNAASPMLVPTMPQAASYLHQQLQPQQAQQDQPREADKKQSEKPSDSLGKDEPKGIEGDKLEQIQPQGVASSNDTAQQGKPNSEGE